MATGRQGENHLAQQTAKAAELQRFITDELMITLGQSPVSTIDAVVSGGGLGTVNLTGTEVVNVTGTASRDVTVNGTAEDDDLVYQPTGADAGSIQKTGLGLIANLSQVANLIVGGAGGDDTLTVKGTAAADAFTTISATAVLVTGLQGVNTLGTVEALRVYGLEGADTFAVDRKSTRLNSSHT